MGERNSIGKHQGRVIQGLPPPDPGRKSQIPFLA
jgi:hypothetical protein